VKSREELARQMRHSVFEIVDEKPKEVDEEIEALEEQIINEEENSKIFIKSENNLSKLLKMTKKELQIILDEKKIKVNISKMLKKDIVDLICKEN
jgi:hypothetical protein